MSGYEFLSNIITGATWPLVVLVLGFVFRDTLRSVFERLKGVEGLGAKLELSESVKRVDDAADSVEIEAAEREVQENPDGKPVPAPYVPLSHLIEVARLSPVAAIVEAWREVEDRLFAYWSSARNTCLLRN